MLLCFQISISLFLLSKTLVAVSYKGPHSALEEVVLLPHNSDMKVWRNELKDCCSMKLGSTIMWKGIVPSKIDWLWECNLFFLYCWNKFDWSSFSTLHTYLDFVEQVFELVRYSMVYARKYLSDVNQWSGIVKEKKFKVE